MELVKNHNTIQMTLYDYFEDTGIFTLDEAKECVKKAKMNVKEPSIRARIYEGIEKGFFERIEKGVYTIKRKDSKGNENTCLVINGDGRDLSNIEDNSIDCIITDHPYLLEKSLKGGNRNFASYECFRYDQKDFDEKARVMKEGCFLIEFMPEENSENYKYIFKVKEMAEKSGLNYYATVPWKKGDFVSNTGRKAKNTENIVFFTKGKARSLKLDMKKIGNVISNPQILEYKNEHLHLDVGDNSENKMDMELKLIVSSNDYKKIYSDLDAAWNNWFYEECENSILLDDETTQDDLLQIPFGDYLNDWLRKKDYNYIDIESEEFERGNFLMSGTNGMLPTVFDINPVPKNDKIHQAEKPVELLEKVLSFVSKKNEKVLDQFAGSGVLGEAAINTGRNSLLIEKDISNYDKIVKRMKGNSR